MTVAATDDKTVTPSEFDKLLGELDILAKATCKTDDKKIAVAAEEGTKADPDDDDDDDDEAKGGKKTMAKSLTVTLADGSVVEAEDGTELIKALQTQLEETIEGVSKTEAAMLKGLTAAVGLIKGQGEMLKSQGETIATLQTQITKLSGEGRGRKAVVTLADRTSATEEMNKSEGKGIAAAELMTKATEKFGEGKITGLELSTLEASLNRGIVPPPEFVRRIVG